MAQQSVEIKKQIYNYAVGTGKDCKLFLTIAMEEKGKRKYYQIPLTTIVSLQVFTSTEKEPRYTFGDPDPRGLTHGFKRISGHITAVVFNESIGERIRKELKNYSPVEGSKLNLDTDGVIELSELDRLKHLDELPPCQIKLFITHPISKLVYSKSIVGVKFTSSGYSIGGSATMGEQYSFVAVAVTPVKLEKVSNKSELNPGSTI